MKMKKSSIISKIITSALIITSLTACGEVSEMPANNNSSSSETKTTESSAEISVSETVVSNEPKTEVPSENSVTETETVVSSEIKTESSSENSVSKTETAVSTETQTELSEEISVPENANKSYKSAYIEKATELDDGKCKFNLIYFDDDDIPELVAGEEGYYTSLYTYSNDELYTLMEHWSYGVMGNAGYEYVPKKNSLRNYNSDYAGAIRYTTYMAISESHSMDTVAQIETFNFDDVNGNGIPDEDESDSIGKYSKSYIDGSEISEEDAERYNVGEYEFISVSMTLDELKTALD